MKPRFLTTGTLALYQLPLKVRFHITRFFLSPLNSIRRGPTVTRFVQNLNIISGVHQHKMHFPFENFKRRMMKKGGKMNT